MVCSSALQFTTGERQGPSEMSEARSGTCAFWSALRPYLASEYAAVVQHKTG